MKKILVFQHVAHEVLGTLDPLLRQAGFRIRYVNFGRDPMAKPRLDGYDGLVVLGGPMNVGQAREFPHIPTEIELIDEAIDRDLPILGVCLGAQLIAAALGARVYPAPEKEIGWYPIRLSEGGRTDPLLGHLNDEEYIFQWHGDTFDIPEGAVHLASSPICPNQAFRYGSRVYALQFHMEVDQAMIERWLRVPRHLEELAELRGRIDPERIRRETPVFIGRLQEAAQQTFRKFIELLGLPRKKLVLPSA
ncbi:MAG: glutamine amidotransferase [Candidatus Dadabacteria bacterium]|nr:MAG: glutamine amidotransferase [Candidatus Dadabacteria bacterium]